MYQFTLNQVQVLLADKSQLADIKKDPTIMTTRYKNQKELKQFMTAWMVYEGEKTVCVYHHNVEKLRYYFIQNYKP